MKNILYLREMGMNDKNIRTDIQNHRVRVLENVDIIYQGQPYNMFFEFTQCNRQFWRDTNKRAGKPLKKSVLDRIEKDRLHLDTEYEKVIYQKNCAGKDCSCKASFRSNLDQEVWEENLPYTREAVLSVVNRYKEGEPFTEVVLVQEKTRDIIREKGGAREKSILADGANFQTDGDSYIKIAQWDDSHKIVAVIRRIWEPTYNGRRLKEVDSCEVDLITGEITG